MLGPVLRPDADISAAVQCTLHRCSEGVVTVLAVFHDAQLVYLISLAVLVPGQTDDSQDFIRKVAYRIVQFLFPRLLRLYPYHQIH